MRGFSFPGSGVLLGLSLNLLPCVLQAGIIPFDPFKMDNGPSPFSFTEPLITKPEDPPLEEFALQQGPFVIPGLWAQQLVGFDFIQEEIDQRELHPVTVYVADAGVKVGANRKLEIQGEPYKARRIKLRIVNTFKGTKLGDFIDRLNSALPVSIADPRDPAGPSHPSHGTFVAGLIGSGLNVVGAGRSNTVVDIDIFKGVEQYRVENLLEGLQRIEDDRPRNAVFNLSVEVHDNEKIASALSHLASTTDTVVVLASGNGGRELTEDSAASKAENILVVGALGVSGAITSFSNYGDAIDLVAPGENVISRGLGFKWRDQGVEFMDGTSFAAPIVAGSASNIRAILPNATPEVVRTILTRTAIDLGLEGKDEQFGYGLVNSYRAAVVAKRLARMGLTSKDALEMAMTTDAIFNTTELERLAQIEAKKAGFGSPLYEKHIRRKVLLNGKAEAFEQLGMIAMTNGTTLYGMGLLFASLNYAGRVLNPEELKLATSVTWALQNARVQTFRDVPVLRGLANPDLIISSYEAMHPILSEKLTPIFEERLLKAAPDRLSTLQLLAAEKAQKLLEVAPSVAVSRAP